MIQYSICLLPSSPKWTLVITQILSELIINLKVLLYKRKRHTAHCIASTHHAVPVKGSTYSGGRVPTWGGTYSCGGTYSGEGGTYLGGGYLLW